MRKWLDYLIVLVALSFFAPIPAQASAVVTDGAFTIVYVYPDPSQETWEQHIAGQGLNASQFSRASIDLFVSSLMSQSVPSYFDALGQYSGIHPPRFFGSSQVRQYCVDAATKDANSAGGVMQWDTIRSLANCHPDGMDPSPQVILVFSPEVAIGSPTVVGTTGSICPPNSGVRAWHAWGLNVPNFIAMSTNPNCSNFTGLSTFAGFTMNLSHEIVETLSDPAGTGVGDLGQNEVGDKCQSANTQWGAYTVQQYWSDSANGCIPAVNNAPSPDLQRVLIDVSGAPLVRFSGDVHDWPVDVTSRILTPRQVKRLRMTISTGGDNLNGGSNPGDNCDVTIYLSDGRSIFVPNVNNSQSWDSWTIHSFDIPLPQGGLSDQDVTRVSLHTGFGGGLSGDNWNVERVQLGALESSTSNIIDQKPLRDSIVVNVSVTINGVSDVASIDPQYSSLVTDYAKVKIQGSNYVIDPSGQQTHFVQAVSLSDGVVPIQIEIWRDVRWKFIRVGPDSNGKFYNQRVPDVTAGMLRTLTLSYDLNAHQFTSADRVSGSLGSAAVLPPDGPNDPGLSFMITDDRAKPAGENLHLKVQPIRPGAETPSKDSPVVSDKLHRFVH